MEKPFHSNHKFRINVQKPYKFAIAMQIPTNNESAVDWYNVSNRRIYY